VCIPFEFLMFFFLQVPPETVPKPARRYSAEKVFIFLYLVVSDDDGDDEMMMMFFCFFCRRHI
jgi:hypothetical protein